MNAETKKRALEHLRAAYDAVHAVEPQNGNVLGRIYTALQGIDVAAAAAALSRQSFDYSKLVSSEELGLLAVKDNFSGDSVAQTNNAPAVSIHQLLKQQREKKASGVVATGAPAAPVVSKKEFRIPTPTPVDSPLNAVESEPESPTILDETPQTTITVEGLNELPAEGLLVVPAAQETPAALVRAIQPAVESTTESAAEIAAKEETAAQKEEAAQKAAAQKEAIAALGILGAISNGCSDKDIVSAFSREDLIEAAASLDLTFTSAHTPAKIVKGIRAELAKA